MVRHDRGKPPPAIDYLYVSVRPAGTSSLALAPHGASQVARREITPASDNPPRRPHPARHRPKSATMITRPVTVATLAAPADRDASAARDASPAAPSPAVATAHLNSRTPANSGLYTGETAPGAQCPALLSGAAPEYPEPRR